MPYGGLLGGAHVLESDKRSAHLVHSVAENIGDSGAQNQKEGKEKDNENLNEGVIEIRKGGEDGGKDTHLVVRCLR